MSSRPTVKLKHPITIAGREVVELAFRRPKAKDMRGLNFGEEKRFDMIFELAGRLSGETDVVIGELDIEDMMEVQAVVGGFFSGGLKTGNEPSQS